MKKILAALDNSIAATPVLATARMLAELLDAEVDAVHVRVNGARVVDAATASAGIRLRLLDGKIVDAVVAEANDPGVVATVVGARASPASSRPLGSTALAVAQTLLKPLVAVPPDLGPPAGLRRILVPIEGGVSTAPLPHAIVQIARSAGEHAIDVVVLHVLEAQSLPCFTDQPQHEQPAWAREFVRRYSPWGIGKVSLETRVGRAEELVAQVARDMNVDLVALGWAQELAEGRAAVVRAALARGGVPIMLVPVQVIKEEESPWSGSQLSPA